MADARIEQAMVKMAEINQTIEKIRKAWKPLNNDVKWLKEMHATECELIKSITDRVDKILELKNSCDRMYKEFKGLESRIDKKLTELAGLITKFEDSLKGKENVATSGSGSN